MIVVIDYKAGNLYNVGNALKHLGVDFVFSADPEQVKRADRVILPGVGSARAAMQSLQEQGLVEVLQNIRVPFLGICLGLQLLFERSEEDETPCLGILPGTVARFDSSRQKVPHIGWNQVIQRPQDEQDSKLFDGIPDGGYFYFVHSYYAPGSSAYAVAVTDYGVTFASAVRKDHIWGLQFHPERSGELGLNVLRNFLE